MICRSPIHKVHYDDVDDAAVDAADAKITETTHYSTHWICENVQRESASVVMMIMLCVLTGSGRGRGRRLMPATSAPASTAAAAAAMDPAFKVIPRNSTCFLIWRVEVPYVIQRVIDYHDNVDHTVAETSHFSYYSRYALLLCDTTF